jgi:hypothetical protein
LESSWPLAAPDVKSKNLRTYGPAPKREPKREPYIITHPGYRPVVEERFRKVLAAFGEPAQPGYLGGSAATK